VQHLRFECSKLFCLMMPGLFVLPLPMVVSEVEAGVDCPQEVLQQGEPRGDERLVVHAFEQGKYDLAISSGSADIDKALYRISYSGHEDACMYRPLFLARGGDWGWHLLWMETGKGVYYARMDGQAWVSSPKRRLAEASVQDVQLSIEGAKLTVHWRAESGEPQSRISEDKGRSWD
jgi:hypothetical protein